MSHITLRKLNSLLLLSVVSQDLLTFVMLERPYVENLLRPCLMAIAIAALLVLSACTARPVHEADKLNALSYQYHYRNLDSTRLYAQRAMALSGDYPAGKAEALNNLAFVSMAKMDYARALSQLDSVDITTANHVEQLIADIGRMRLCQRKSQNKDFYEYRERALRHLHRIEEDPSQLNPHQLRRLNYARSELAIVTSTYYYYVGLGEPSVAAMAYFDQQGALHGDTAQLLAYYYNIGAGGLITASSPDETARQEFDYLMNCYTMAVRTGQLFWQANSLQALSEHLQDPAMRRMLTACYRQDIEYLNSDNMPDSLLAGNLAQRSLNLFTKYGDVYQIAGAYRTLAECYFAIGDYRSAMICLEQALNDNKAIGQAPDLVASIREQMSEVCAALYDKQGSDYNRNIYLDLQEKTRQDRYLESRAEQLERSSSQLSLMIAAVVVMIVVVVMMLFIFDRLRRSNNRGNALQQLQAPLEQWQRNNAQEMERLADEQEEVGEAYARNVMRIEAGKRRYLEQRARISMANQVMPLIDRMLHEVRSLLHKEENRELRAERMEYIADLTDMINVYNDVLTQWIELRQGRLQLHVESFPLSQVFDIIKRGSMAFRLKGIALDIEPTTAVVKADRILTIFMLNTIADNARKYTPEGGRVTIGSTESDDYVEVSVTDNGSGMTYEQLQQLFSRLPAATQQAANAQFPTAPPPTPTQGRGAVSTTHQSQQGHGFGLLNCKGIIESYKKLSPIFNVCTLSAESSPGRGSRFFFRLPKGVVRLFVAVALSAASLLGTGAQVVAANGPSLTKAAVTALQQEAGRYADSAYYCNINAQYERTLLFADSCMQRLNKLYLELRPGGSPLMTLDSRGTDAPAELAWHRDSVALDYSIVLDMRNEAAVAALALHRWQLYEYNNNAYTQLFKEQSSDHGLAEYCRNMQKSETNKNVAIVLLSLLFVSIFPAYYFLYYRHRLYYEFCLDRVKRINEILLEDIDPQEKLNRIDQLATNRFPHSLQTIVAQVRQALGESCQLMQTSKINIEMARDELRRTEMEDEKYHVINSVLDNCLSALKHETMYYPSRIRQLLDNGSSDTVQMISELLAYYKELYAILSRQATNQLNRVRIECRLVRLTELLPAKVEVTGAEGIELRGDRVMLAYLFALLQKQVAPGVLTIAAEDVGGGYVELRLSLPQAATGGQQDIFAPSPANIPYMLCRQIVRDVGESTHLRRCGIVAKPSSEGVNMTIILAEKAFVENVKE